MDNNNKNKMIKFFGFIWFAAMLLFAIWYFAVSSLNTANQILLNNAFFSIDRGSFFLPGIIFGLGLLIFLMVYEGILKLSLTHKFTLFLKKLSIISIILILFLPFLSDYFFSKYADINNYSRCSTASYEYSWPFFKEVYFVKNKQVCAELSEKENKRMNHNKSSKRSSTGLTLP